MQQFSTCYYERVYSQPRRSLDLKKPRLQRKAPKRKSIYAGRLRELRRCTLRADHQEEA